MSCRQYRLIEKIAKIVLDVSKGDTVLMGRFKNMKVVVKKIGKDDHGMPTINGKKAATFRYGQKKNEKTAMPSIEMLTRASKKGKAMLQMGMTPFGKEFKKSKQLLNINTVLQRRKSLNDRVAKMLKGKK